jgi:hypothetical protein
MTSWAEFAEQALVWLLVGIYRSKSIHSWLDGSGSRGARIGVVSGLRLAQDHLAPTGG